MTRDKMSNSMLVQQFVIIGFSSFLHIFLSLSRERNNVLLTVGSDDAVWWHVFIFKNTFDLGFGRNS